MNKNKFKRILLFCSVHFEIWDLVKVTLEDMILRCKSQATVLKEVFNVYN